MIDTVLVESCTLLLVLTRLASPLAPVPPPRRVFSLSCSVQVQQVAGDGSFSFVCEAKIRPLLASPGGAHLHLHVLLCNNRCYIILGGLRDLSASVYRAVMIGEDDMRLNFEVFESISPM